MRFIKNNKGIIITVLIAIVVLIISFFGSGNSDVPINEKIDTEDIKVEEKQPEINKETIEPEKEIIEIKEETPKTKEIKAPEAPKEDEVKKEEETGLFCTLSVRCDMAVGKNEDKSIIIPENGVIFAEKRVEFKEGESVFDILFKEMKENKIHLEFVNIPLYKSAYIEGIGNLYEFDCGELSGWMYKVNGWFPNYGSSGYTVKKDDKIEWVYTCDLGKDVGGEYSKRNGFDNE